MTIGKGTKRIVKNDIEITNYIDILKETQLYYKKLYSKDNTLTNNNNNNIDNNN